MKLPVAMRARVLGFRMVQHVNFQLALAFETPSVRANLALEISLLAVSDLMVFQVGLGGETFTASGTRVGLFSRVRPLVDF